MTIKKNVPYKVLKGLWIALMPLLILNLIGLWIAWNNGADNGGAFAFGIISGILVLLDLIAMGVVAILNINQNVRMHGFAYFLLAVVHLIFVILMATLRTKDGEPNPNAATPALFTVFIIVIAIVALYFAFFQSKHRLQAFGKALANDDEGTVKREDVGRVATEEAVHEAASAHPDHKEKKSGRDEKTGIVSL